MVSFFESILKPPNLALWCTKPLRRHIIMGLDVRKFIKLNGFLPKTGIPSHFGAQNRYILKPSTNHTPGALRLAGLTSYLFFALNGQVHPVLSI